MDFMDYMLIFGGAMLAIMLVTTVISLLMILANVKIYQKAGRPGWAAIVPYYNSYVKAEFSGCTNDFWFFLVATLISTVQSWLFEFVDSTALSFAFIGVALLASIIAVVFAVRIEYRMAKAFGHGVGFTLGLIFLPVIFYPILAWGQSSYVLEMPNPYNTETSRQENATWRDIQ